MDGGSEPCPAPAADHGQITAGADPVQQHGQRSPPALGVQRSRSGSQHGRPGTFQQVPDLLPGSAGSNDQSGPAGAQMPQPGPRRFRTLGQITPQLGDQPSDDHRVGVIALVIGEVLGFPSPTHQQRLHTHQPHAHLGSDQVQHPPAVPGRLAGDHHRGEPRPLSPFQAPHDSLPQLPRLHPHSAASQHPRVLIRQRAHLLISGQIKGEHRRLTRDHSTQPDQLTIPTTIPTREPTTTIRHTSS